jgi:stage II sporulation protein D
MRRFHGILVSVALVALAGCAGTRPPMPAPEGGPAPEVRVGILLHADEAKVGALEPYTLSDPKGTLTVGRKGETFRVRREKDRLLVFGKSGEFVASTAGPIRLQPDSRAGEVSVAGKRYPGRLEIRVSPSAGMNVINATDVESYLRAVVPLEIGHAGNDYREAAKAQAVAARTYAGGHMGQNPGEGYDMVAGVSDQVYGSVDKRDPDADRAVAETRGLILVHDGKPIRANYSSTCGGRTAAVEESFDADPVSYLKSRKDELNGEIACRTSKYYRWKESWTGDDLVRILAHTVPAVLGKPWKGASVRDVKAVERGKSGRVTRLRIKTDQAEYEARKGAIRRVLERDGGGALWSTWFDLKVKRSGDKVRRLTAEGRGWGHGVGMCQWGAMQLSKDGVGYRRILEHYYPGTRLKQWYQGMQASREAR